MKPRPADIAGMRRALALAERAAGEVGHYPLVGAVIVKRGDIIAEGWFKKPGEPHAEVKALARAGDQARGADLILNLEPCSHFGRTPPCAEAVIKAGIKRVVAGMMDPNPLVSGRGFKKLRAAGLEVVTGVLEEECRKLNRVFVKFITTGRPFVIIKAAATLDGKIATRSGDSKWITGKEARAEAHKLRDLCQAVMAGAGTVRSDDPELTARLSPKHRHPRPVVISSKLELPLRAKIMKTPAEGGPLIFTTKSAPLKKLRAFERAGAEVVAVKKRGERVDLHSVMRELGRRKIASLLVEGGAELHGELIRAGLVDEVVIFIAPTLLGGGLPMSSGRGPAKLAEALPLEDMKIKRAGRDLMIRARAGKKQPA